MSRVLVTNATGQVSAAVIANLTSAGHDVVAASRNPKAPPHPRIHRVHFDYTDPSTFPAALEGVERLFWLSPPLVLDGFSLARPFLDLALERVKKVVVMTASGVQHDDTLPLRRIERLVETSGVAWAHLRPTWFMDNFHTFWAAPMKTQQVIPLPAGDGRTAFVDVRDIGASAAAALTRDDVAGRAYTITGPEALTYAQAAKVLGDAAGHPMHYVPVDDASFVQAMTGVGISEAYARMLTVLFGAVRQGAAAEVTTAVRDLTGRAPRSLEAYAREHAAAW